MTELPPKQSLHSSNGAICYTEADLITFGRAEYLRAIEQCAQVCDAQEEKSVAAMVKTKRVKDRDIYSAAAQTVHWVGDAIRALAKEQQT